MTIKTELEHLNEALKSKKTYDEMSSHVAAIKDDTFHNVAHAVLHNAPQEDRQQNDYARHAVLFNSRLSDQHLNAVADHVAKQGKTSNELDKNFHKNVNSVATLRTALKSKSSDMVNDAKKALTSDHKNAIMSHGTEHEKEFVISNGLASKTHLSNALEGGDKHIKRFAMDHLQHLKDTGSTLHADLIAKHLPKENSTKQNKDFNHVDDKSDSDTIHVNSKGSVVPKNKPSFISRVKDKFSSAIGSIKKSAGVLATSKPKQQRIEPAFEGTEEMTISTTLAESLFDAIAASDLVGATEQLDLAMSSKVSEKMEEIKEKIAKEMFVTKEGTSNEAV